MAQAGRVRPVLACAINCAACLSCICFLLGLTARYNRTVSAFRESPPPSPQPRVGRRARGEDTTNGTVLHGRARVWASDLWFFALGPCFLQAPLSTNISGSGHLVSTLSSLRAGVRLLDAAAVNAHDMRRAGCAGRMCEVRGGREVVCNLGVVYADDEAALGACLGVRFHLASVEGQSCTPAFLAKLHPSFSSALMLCSSAACCKAFGIDCTLGGPWCLNGMDSR